MGFALNVTLDLNLDVTSDLEPTMACSPPARIALPRRRAREPVCSSHQRRKVAQDCGDRDVMKVAGKFRGKRLVPRVDRLPRPPRAEARGIPTSSTPARDAPK
jgi:hypothetical protein